MNGLVTTAPAAVLGQLPYSTVNQFETAQTRLAAMLEDARGPRATAARGLEALARRNRKLGRLSDDTMELLKKGARWELPVMKVPDDEPIARESFAALMAAGVLDGSLIEAALGEDSRGSAGSARSRSSATGATLADQERTRLVRAALEDRDYTVRYDALRAWIRHETPANGCGPIAEALGDQSLHLVLAAIDALGDRCAAGRRGGRADRPPVGGASHAARHRLVAS